MTCWSGWRASAATTPSKAPARQGNASRAWSRRGCVAGPDRHRSRDGGLHQLGDLLLHQRAPLLERVRHRPHVPVVEVGGLLEAQGRVPVLELAGVLEEDDDLAVRV